MLCQADPELARSFLARSLEGASVLSEPFMSSTNGSLIGSLIGCLRLPQGTECSRMSFDAQLPLPRRGPLCRFQRLRALRQRFFSQLLFPSNTTVKQQRRHPKPFQRRSGFETVSPLEESRRSVGPDKASELEKGGERRALSGSQSGGWRREREREELFFFPSRLR